MRLKIRGNEQQTEGGVWAQGSMEGWAGFVEDMRQFYGMDLDCLSKVP